MLRLVGRPAIPLLLACVIVTLGAVQGAAGQTPKSSSSKGPIAYRWVDEQGVVHYGDHIPPQYAMQDRAVLNGQGVEVGHLDAQKTPEQVVAEARARASQIRQRQHDAFLITTYTSVKDIEALRDVRLEQMRGQRAAAEQYLESLRARLAALETRALNFQPYKTGARRMPDDLAENLVRTVNEVETQGRDLTAKSEQENALREQFQEDIERYKALHTIHSQ